MDPLPPPVAGVPFDLETAAGRVTGYRLGEGRTVLLLHPVHGLIFRGTVRVLAERTVRRAEGGPPTT
jgi:hypothetical protein